MAETEPDFAKWIGREVLDRAGAPVGKVVDVFLDAVTREPEWLTVSTRVLERPRALVPLQGAAVRGDRIIVGWDHTTVVAAPPFADHDMLSPEDEDELYRYYERSLDPATTGDHQPLPPAADMIRSEEHAHFGTRRQEVGRARLRKYVVTEQVTRAVNVAHEQLQVERQALSSAERAVRGVALSEEEVEIVLFEERPVVQKEVVAVERVRLDKETVADHQVVTAEVRKELVVEERRTVGN